MNKYGVFGAILAAVIVTFTVTILFVCWPGPPRHSQCPCETCVETGAQ